MQSWQMQAANANANAKVSEVVGQAQADRYRPSTACSLPLRWNTA